jgi:hypothetical protein
MYPSCPPPGSAGIWPDDRGRGPAGILPTLSRRSTPGPQAGSGPATQRQRERHSAPASRRSQVNPGLLASHHRVAQPAFMAAMHPAGHLVARWAQRLLGTCLGLNADRPAGTKDPLDRGPRQVREQDGKGSQDRTANMITKMMITFQPARRHHTLTESVPEPDFGSR